MECRETRVPKEKPRRQGGMCEFHKDSGLHQDFFFLININNETTLFEDLLYLLSTYSHVLYVSKINRNKKYLCPLKLTL